MNTRDEYEKRRNRYCWSAVILGFLGNVFRLMVPPLGILIVLTALILALVGGYNWAKMKGRSGAWCLWAILFPIGFVGLAVLRDRWGMTPTNSGQEPGWRAN